MYAKYPRDSSQKNKEGFWQFAPRRWIDEILILCYNSIAVVERTANFIWQELDKCGLLGSLHDKKCSISTKWV